MTSNYFCIGQSRDLVTPSNRGFFGDNGALIDADIWADINNNNPPYLSDIYIYFDCRGLSAVGRAEGEIMCSKRDQNMCKNIRKCEQICAAHILPLW